MKQKQIDVYFLQYNFNSSYSKENLPLSCIYESVKNSFLEQKKNSCEDTVVVELKVMVHNLADLYKVEW